MTMMLNVFLNSTLSMNDILPDDDDDGDNVDLLMKNDVLDYHPHT